MKAPLSMIPEHEVHAQFERILTELPHHPAPRRFCWLHWEWDDYCQLAAKFLHCGQPLLVNVLPDVSILVGPPATPCHLVIR